MKPLEWFEERKGEEVVCTMPSGEVRIFPMTEPKHYFKMQERGYTFEAYLK